MSRQEIQLTVQKYNLIPAQWRKTMGGQQHVWFNDREWRQVKFVKNTEPPCLRIPETRETR